jgi:hypothetical protein
VILSNNYIEELRLLPPNKMNGKEANIKASDSAYGRQDFCILMVFKNLHGEYTYSTEILSNNLHVRAIQNGLTPNLSGFLVRANEELELGLQEDMPNTEGLLYLYLEP